MKKITLVEPNRGYSVIQESIKLQEKYPWIEQFAPIGADIFLIIYPIFLVVLYLHGMIKKQVEEKAGALFIFFSCLFSVGFNIFLQTFFLKNRPNIILSEVKVDETLLHQYLPTSSFPSDHAVVSMSIAIATLIRGHKTKNLFLIRFSCFLIIASLIMSGCRVLTIVHRPTDIIGGCILGILIPLILTIPFIYNYLRKRMINPIISLQEKIFNF